MIEPRAVASLVRRKHPAADNSPHRAVPSRDRDALGNQRLRREPTDDGVRQQTALLYVRNGNPDLVDMPHKSERRTISWPDMGVGVADRVTGHFGER